MAHTTAPAASPNWREIMEATVARHGFSHISPEALEEIHAMAEAEGWNQVASGTTFPGWKVRSAYFELMVELEHMFAPAEAA